METEGVRNGKWYLRRIFTLPLLCIETLPMMALGEVIGMSVGLLSKAFPSLEGNDAWVTGRDYAEFWGIWLVVILVLSLIKKNRPVLEAIGRKGRGNTVPFFLLGGLLGFGMNALCVLLAILTGSINISFSSFHIIPFLLLFVAVFLQSGAEELVCRGFLYQRLRRAYKSPLVAIIGNSVFFAFLHIFNDGADFAGILNTFVIAILLSLIVCYTGSFWCASAVHTAWNFTQNILFGLPNSGNVMPYSVFKLNEGASNSFFYDRAFGIEGSLFSSIVILSVAIMLMLYVKKHNLGEVYIWSEDGKA